MLGDKVRGERATYNSKKSLGYANLFDLIFKSQTSDSHSRPSCAALSCCRWKSIITTHCKSGLQSSTACKAEHHNSTQCTVPYRSSPRITENWHWKDAEGGISSIPLDKCRISYSPSQIWNFVLNPITIVDPQHSEARMEQAAMYKKMDRRPSSPCPVCIFQAPCDSQGKTLLSGNCYHKFYLTIAVLSLRQLLDTFQLPYRSSKLKQQQTLPKSQKHALTQSKNGRF